MLCRTLTSGYVTPVYKCTDAGPLIVKTPTGQEKRFHLSFFCPSMVEMRKDHCLNVQTSARLNITRGHLQLWLYSCRLVGYAYGIRRKHRKRCAVRKKLGITVITFRIFPAGENIVKNPAPSSLISSLTRLFFRFDGITAPKALLPLTIKLVISMLTVNVSLFLSYFV